MTPVCKKNTRFGVKQRFLSQFPQMWWFFHAKQVHQPALGLQTIPLSWPFAVWGLDILGPFPRSSGGYRYLYVAIDKFTKWAEVEAVRSIPARSAVKFIRSLACRFGVTLVA